MRITLAAVCMTAAACQSGGLASQKSSASNAPQSISNPNTNATPTTGPAGADPQALADAQKQAASNNDKEAADVAAFSSNGWALVEPQVPDLELVGFNPALLAAGRESDLRMQLASTTPKAEDVANIVTIAQQTQNDDVRSQAVRALSRVETPAAQQGLMTLALSFPATDEARQHALASLRPPSVSDPLTVAVAKLIADTRLSESEQNQLAFTIALLEARDSAAVLGLPDAAQVKVDSMSSLLRGAR